MQDIVGGNQGHTATHRTTLLVVRRSPQFGDLGLVTAGVVSQTAVVTQTKGTPLTAFDYEEIYNKDKSHNKSDTINSKPKGFIMGLSIGVACLLLVIGMAVYFLYRRRRRKIENAGDASTVAPSPSRKSSTNSSWSSRLPPSNIPTRSSTNTTNFTNTTRDPRPRNSSHNLELAPICSHRSRSPEQFPNRADDGTLMSELEPPTEPKHRISNHFNSRRSTIPPPPPLLTIGRHQTQRRSSAQIQYTPRTPEHIKYLTPIAPRNELSVPPAPLSSIAPLNTTQNFNRRSTSTSSSLDIPTSNGPCIAAAATRAKPARIISVGMPKSGMSLASSIRDKNASNAPYFNPSISESASSSSSSHPSRGATAPCFKPIEPAPLLSPHQYPAGSSSSSEPASTSTPPSRGANAPCFNPIEPAPLLPPHQYPAGSSSLSKSEINASNAPYFNPGEQPPNSPRLMIADPDFGYGYQSEYPEVLGADPAHHSGPEDRHREMKYLDEQERLIRERVRATEELIRLKNEEARILDRKKQLGIGRSR